MLQNRPDDAIEHYRQAAALEPNLAEAHKNLAGIHKDRGQVEEAIAGFRAALRAKPDYPDALNRLGVALFEQGKLDEAAVCYRRAIEVQPEFVEAHNNLGTLFLEQERLDEAVAAYEKALAVRPLLADTHFNLGNALKVQGKLVEAVASYRRALNIKPDQSKVYNNLGNALRLMARLPEAIDCYVKAAQESPNDVMLLDNLGATYKQMGVVEKAADAYRRTLPLRPANPLYQLRIDSLCPPVFSSLEAMDRFHEQFHSALDRCCQTDIRLTPEEIVGVGCEPPFDVAYHGRDERRMREKFAAIFRHCFARADPPRNNPVGLLRIAMIVTRDHEGIFLRAMRGLIEHLDSNRFALSIVGAESGVQRLRGEIANPDVKFLAVADNFQKWVETIRNGQFDLLYFWEVGSDPFNYFLPFLKLAPVQCVGWGTNYTSGVSQIDYYLSSSLVEPAEAEAHYTENLVCLGTLPTYQYRPQPPKPLKSREAFGLSRSEHLYYCPHNVRKFHPEFDPLLGRILRGDPAGVLLIPKPQYEHLEAALRSRFQRTLAGVVGRIRFVPWTPYPDYLNLSALADVLLDPLHYGGGVTTYDALAMGAPIVTLPSAYQRGRYTWGCYQKMQFLDCVASSAEHYVELVLRLGTDRDYRRVVSEKILAAGNVLFEDLDAVRQHEQFFIEAIEAERRL
ncbi:MAG: tetratricopeptide repeat protein [Thermoguttaceae bacterium]